MYNDVLRIQEYSRSSLASASEKYRSTIDFLSVLETCEDERGKSKSDRKMYSNNVYVLLMIIDAIL